MKQITWTFFAALAAYSIALLLIEANTSQDYVRHYFSDIDGGRPFFAINTTLSTFLLAGAAILLVFAATSGREEIPTQSRRLMWSQAAMLVLLAFDDRFQLHEALAYRLNIADHFVMAAWTALEAALILTLAKLDEIPVRSFVLVAAGGIFFVVMMLFDAVMPHDMVMRLSIEDLAKSWAAALFFAACWCLARFHLGFDDRAPTLAAWLRTQRKPTINQDLSRRR